ncbi:C40 family peptidase [Cellulosilyticum ruminicola]|uniref:C40 family peptidase n=1 Tax=Cellulosilyticum ruminicola TaxID=425254 RepID=UPI0006D0AA81|nr:C40 family peptidase [Cellulosilyticum ruminicola]
MKNVKSISVLLATLLMTSVSVFGAEISAQGTVNATVRAYNSAQELKETCYIYEGETFKIVEDLDGYYGILIDDKEVVYIEKEYISVEKEVVKEEPKAEVTTEKKAPVKAKTTKVEVKKSKGQEIVTYAKKFIGTPYVYGGNSLTSGVDCSGFTQQVFRNFNVKLERRSRDQYASNGVAVKKSDLKPGDLVFYGYSNVTHVAIYIGNEQIIHASTPGQTVSIAPVWQRGDAPIMGYRRVI